MDERYFAADLVLLVLTAHRKGAMRLGDFRPVIIADALMSEFELSGHVSAVQHGNWGAKSYVVQREASAMRGPQAQALADLRDRPLQPFEIFRLAKRWTAEVLAELEAAGLLVQRQRFMRQTEWVLESSDGVESLRAHVTRILVDGAPPTRDDAVLLTHLAQVANLERVTLRPARDKAHSWVCTDPECRCLMKVPIHRMIDFVRHARARHRHDLPFAARDLPDTSWKPADFLPWNW